LLAGINRANIARLSACAPPCTVATIAASRKNCATVVMK
jgi:hypothetical protein